MEITITKEHKKYLLEEVKKRFPIGTNFTSLFGAQDMVTKPEDYGDKNVYLVYDDGSVGVRGRYEYRMVFNGLLWADIIPLTVDRTVQVYKDGKYNDQYGVVKTIKEKTAIVKLEHVEQEVEIPIAKLFIPSLHQVIKHELYD